MSPLRMIATLYLVLSVGSCGWSEDTASFVQSILHPRITDTKAAATDLEEQPTRDEKKWRPALKRLPHAHQRSVHDIQFQLPRSVEPHENIDDFRDVAAQKCVVWTPARVRYGSIQFRDESLEREGKTNAPLLQPGISVLRFTGDILTWPLGKVLRWPHAFRSSSRD